MVLGAVGALGGSEEVSFSRKTLTVVCWRARAGPAEEREERETRMLHVSG